MIFPSMAELMASFANRGRRFRFWGGVMAEHENSIGASDDWHTPPEPFEKLGVRFFLDPCAPLDRTHYFVPADRIYTKEDDGLLQPWFGLVFMNPPFGGRRGHVPWLRKFFKHGNGVAICRAYTSSDWWHDVVLPNAETLLFPNGKTKFIRPDGSVGKEPGHGIALIGMGEIANTALRQSGLGWFVDLRGTHRQQKIAEVDTAQFAAEIAS
jgi:DNA N-6-adenine-methyltransferase Dam